jgi:hypothetical protein
MIAVHGRETLSPSYFQWTGIGQQQDEQARQWQMYPACNQPNDIAGYPIKSHGM